MPRFSLNPTVLLSPVEEGYVAYDTVSNQLHELNPTAALLVELCDGSRAADEIVTLAAPLLPPDSESAVVDWLTTAAARGLLIEQPATHEQESHRPQELTSTELAGLADRLRNGGKVQAAYLCQQRAAELQPDDAARLRDLGELAHIVGQRTAAREAYEAYLQREPDDAEIRHLLTSLRDETAPSRVPDACIQQLYERFSAFYEVNMCDELGYEGPVHLGRMIDEVLGSRQGLSVLDLGCGTGLAGLQVVERASRLVGVDLSAEMIAKAQQRKLYDELHIAEVTAWLRDTDERFDLIIACDTFIYFGDLRQVIAPAQALLKEEGVIAFSVEQAESGEFRLTDNGRYQHHLDHIRDVAQQSELTVAAHAEAFLRMEYGQDVTGLYVALAPATFAAARSPR